MRFIHAWDGAGGNRYMATMKAADIPHVLQIERASFPLPWRRQSFMAELKNPHSLNVVLKMPGILENSTIRAYSCNHIVGDELSILRMAVAPESRRNGLAGLLLDTVLKMSRQQGAATAYLEVRQSNVPGRRLYEKKGFEVIGVRRGYYEETGENALVMMKLLKETS